MKICTKCKVEQSLDKFHKQSDSKDGKTSWCKLCHKNSSAIKYKLKRDEIIARVTKWQKEHPGSHRKRWLSHKYGITLEEYDELLVKQNGVCAVCQEEEHRKGESLSVDHNHETGEIRGLLCGHCNRGIGLLRDSTKFLQRAIEYLNGNLS